jgi:uncharacterized membrane protein YebE (DUF533 family)
MFDAKKLLDQFLSGSGPAELQKRTGVSPDMLKGLAGSAALGGIASWMLGSKSSKNMAGTALKVGGAALIGGIAWKAWQSYQASQSNPVASSQTVFLPTSKPQQNAVSLAILTAMIAAAKSDGHIDAQEQKMIFGKLDAAALDAEAKAFLMDELRKPLDVDAIVALATTPELAVEIYAASVLAIDPDHPAEQEYLNTLASRLNLAPGLKTAVETEAREPAV